MPISSSYYFNGRWYIIDFISIEKFDSIDHSFLFGESCQSHEDQGKIISSCLIDDLQVWNEDKRIKAFQIFVCLPLKISDLEYKFEDKFFSSGGF